VAGDRPCQVDRRADLGGTPIVIGRGYDATVEWDPRAGVVSKRLYAHDRATAAKMALREFDYLGRYAAALSPFPDLACPHPITVDAEQGVVRMSRCPGEPLDALLAERGDEMLEHLDHIARQIVIALERYIETFAEPFYDLTTMNMLYEPATRRLALVDFTKSQDDRCIDPRGARYENSLGFLVGIGVYRTVRPSTWRNRAQWLSCERLLRAVVGGVADGHALQPLVIRGVSDRSYEIMVRSGSAARRLWYGTVGRRLYGRRSAAVIGTPTHGASSRRKRRNPLRLVRRLTKHRDGSA
jgi:hypothetical protein